jgi:CelD/BcsL family acetyltransferase involved in cellulose biosynthesis
MQVYGTGVEPFIPALRDASGHLTGLLPLVRTTAAGALRIAGANLGDVFHPVAAAADEDAVAGAAGNLLARLHRDWSVVILDNVEDGAPWVGSLVHSATIRLGITRGPRTPVPCADIRRGWDGFLESRSANFRSQLGRKRRALERTGTVRFRLTESESDLEHDMRTFFTLHLARWAGRGGSSLSSERAQAFHLSFAREALRLGWLRLWFLEVAGRPVAAWYGWRLGDRYSYYQAGFDSSWSRASVGFLLLAHTVRMAAEEGAAVYDLLLGSEAFKDRFATGYRTVSTVAIGRRLHPARLAAAADLGLRRLGRHLPTTARAHIRRSFDGLVSRLPTARTR